MKLLAAFVTLVVLYYSCCHWQKLRAERVRYSEYIEQRYGREIP